MRTEINGSTPGWMPRWLYKRLQPFPSDGQSMDSMPSMGRLSLALVAMLVLSGLLMALSFHPATAEQAQQSLAVLEEGPFYLRFSRAVHRWSAFMLLLIVFSHMFQILGRRTFRYPRDLNWSLGVILLVFTVLLGSSGFLLRWDVKSLALANLNITQRTQIAAIDSLVSNLVFPGEAEQSVLLGRVYYAHALIVPLLLLSGIGAHLWLSAQQIPESIEANEVEKPKRSVVSRQAPRLTLILGVTTIILLSLLPLEPIAPEPHTGSPWPHPDWLWLVYLTPASLFAKLAGGAGTILIPLGILLLLLLVPRLDPPVTSSKLAAALYVVVVLFFLLIIIQTATQTRQIPHQGCVACHRPTMVGRAPVSPTALNSYNPDWLLFHLRAPVESILIPAQ